MFETTEIPSFIYIVQVCVGDVFPYIVLRVRLYCCLVYTRVIRMTTINNGRIPNNLFNSCQHTEAI